jgi:long-chain acyl-CoA synthetase
MRARIFGWSWSFSSSAIPCSFAQARVQQAIDALNARQASYATIKRFAIVPNDFTQATGELTPTLKVKRKVVTQKYKAILDAFYVE